MPMSTMSEVLLVVMNLRRIKKLQLLSALCSALSYTVEPAIMEILVIHFEWAGERSGAFSC